MIDLNSVLQGLSKSGAVSGFAGGLAGTAMAGALSGKKGKKVAKSALKIGGLAAVGGLAWTAYQRYRQGDNMQSAPGGKALPSTTVGPRPAPGLAGVQSANAAAAPGRWDHIEQTQFEAVVADESSPESGGLLLLRAMIAAATADGHIDPNEHARIFREAQRLELSGQEKALLFDELQHPLSLSELIGHVANPETAVEVYAASLVAVDEQRPEGQAYLRDLAAGLELPGALVQSLHQQADLARQDKAA